MKLVSVIIPTHKGSDSVEKAVKSVLAQTYPNIEIIVVDDNGLGAQQQIETEKALESYIQSGKISYIAHEKNINGSAARNTGFKVSRGEYITLLDDDDIYLPQKIEMSVSALETAGENYGMLYCEGIKLVANGKRELIQAIYSGKLIYKLLCHIVDAPSNSLMIRKSVFEKIGGFDESFKRHQDYEFTVRVAAKCSVLALGKTGYLQNYRVRRNVPREMQIAKEYRAHYIDKMMPYIKTFSAYKQQKIIIYNAVDVIRQNTKNIGLKELYSEVKAFSAKWIKRVRIDIFVSVILSKTFRRLKKEIFLALGIKNINIGEIV